MASSLEWADFNAESLLTTLSTTNPEESRNRLASALRIEPQSTKQSVSLYLYHQALLFCRQKQFALNQISTFLSILRRVHEKSTEEHLTKEASIQYLSKLLVEHSVQRPPYSVGIFNPSQAQDVLEWTLRTYYSQYKIYQHLCGTLMTLTLTTEAVDDFIEQPVSLPPLNEATIKDSVEEDEANQVHSNFFSGRNS